MSKSKIVIGMPELLVIIGVMLQASTYSMYGFILGLTFIILGLMARGLDYVLSLDKARKKLEVELRSSELHNEMSELQVEFDKIDLSNRKVEISNQADPILLKD